MDKAGRIAGRVFTAFTCRESIFDHGFSYDGADKGILAFDYRGSILFWCYPKNGNIEFVYARKASDALKRLESKEGIGYFGEVLNYCFDHGIERTITNLNKMFENSIGRNGMKLFNEALFLIEKKQTMTFDEARSYLTRMWDISLHDFYRIFDGKGADDMVFQWNRMRFEMNDWSLGKDEVENQMNSVKDCLPPSLAGKLLYGEVELKKKFVGTEYADYDIEDDTIRIRENDQFVWTILHELGHRWYHKFCNMEQRKELQKLYKKCKKTSLTAIDFNVGDKIKWIGGATYEVLEIDDDNIKCKTISGKNKGDVSWYVKNQFHWSNVESVNGNKISSEYHLPREYAGKNFDEFVACCFEHAYGGMGMSMTVEKEFREIVES